MSRLLGYVINGLANGAVYALVAMGVVITYRISRVVNLAQGATGVLAAFVFHYTLMGTLGLPVLLATVLAVLLGGVLGVGVERFAVRPVASQGALATLTATTGVLLLFSEITVQLWGPDNPTIASFMSDHVIRIGDTGVTVHQLGTGLAVALVALSLYLLLSRTSLGAGISAIAQDPGAARIVGLPVDRIISLTWFIGGCGAALAGVLYIHLNSLDQISLTFVLISSLVAAVLGGFESLPAACAGGVAVGLLFSLSQGYVDQPGIGQLTVFLALLVVLLTRDHGKQLAPTAQL